VFDTLEARDELKADKALLVSLDMLQKELVLGNICVRKVELDLRIIVLMRLLQVWLAFTMKIECGIKRVVGFEYKSMHFN